MFSQPVLERYQEHHQPEYIHQKAREALEAQGRVFNFPPEVIKKRRLSAGPLEREASRISLPELPVDLRQKQVLSLLMHFHQQGTDVVAGILPLMLLI